MSSQPQWMPKVEEPRWDQGEHPEDLQGWDEPVPLEPPAPPPLDAHKLRGVGVMARAVADSLQVPVDLPAWLGMAVVSTAVGGRRTVSPKQDWVEPVTVYTMPVAAPGEMKSPTLGTMAAPLYAEQKRRRDEDRFAVARDQQDRRIAEACVSDAESKVIKAANPEARRKARESLDMARDDLDSLGDPKVYTQLIADDTTPEAATDVIAEQGERLAVLSTESSFLGNIGGRYSKNANPEIVLKAWSHEPHAVNRKSGRTLLLERPSLSLGLAVQPGFLTGMGDTGDVFEARGLMARFIFSMPASRVGDRVYDTEPIPAEVRQSWNASILTLMANVWEDGERREMTLDRKARESFRTFWEELEPRHKAHGDLASIEGWAKKLPGQVLRIAALLTLFESPTALVVPGDVMDDVVALVPYLIAHARLVADLMSAERQSKLGPARAVLDWLRRKDVRDRFSAGDVEKGVRGQSWCTEMADVDEAIAVLIRAGWLRQIDPPERKEGQRGRPQKARFVAHPDVTSKAESRVISINSMPRGVA